MSMHKLSRRHFLRMSAMTAVGAALAGCVAAVPQAGGSGDPAQDNTIRFWMWNTYAPAADDVLEQGIQAWAAANNITVEISRDSDSDKPAKIMPAIEAGTLPDALFGDSGDALRMQDAGALATLNDTFAEVGEAHGGWLPRLEGYVTREGVIFFLPYSIDTPMMHFRQDIFDAAGLTVPEGQWTWDEVRDLALQAQQYTEEQGDKKIGWGFGIVPEQHDGWCSDLFRNMGVDIWDETGERIILLDEMGEQAAAVLNYAKEAYEMGLFPNDAASWDWSSNNTSYQEEQCIIAINSASIYTWSQTNKPELAEATGLAPKPKAVRDTTNASLRYTVLMTKDGNAPVATQLIKALYDSSIYAPWLEQGFVTNVVHEYDTLPMWEGKRAQFNQAANIGIYGGYPAPYDNAAMSELGSSDSNSPEGKMMVRVLIDGWTPEDAIAETDEFAKRTFEKYFS